MRAQKHTQTRADTLSACSCFSVAHSDQPPPAPVVTRTLPQAKGRIANRKLGEMGILFSLLRSARPPGRQSRHAKHAMQTRPGSAVAARASSGNPTPTPAAPASNLYRVGDVVAELRIPLGGIILRKTSNVSGKLAKRLRNDLPFALQFELVKWYPPIEAQPSTDRRVSYACSSFGVSIPGAVACKCQQ